jgi:hypothetical protein
MSREKLYVFRVMLTADQTKTIQNTIDECLGIVTGEKTIATIQPGQDSMTVMIVPNDESKVLQTQIDAMIVRTEVDNLGLVG